MDVCEFDLSDTWYIQGWNSQTIKTISCHWLDIYFFHLGHLKSHIQVHIYSHTSTDKSTDKTFFSYLIQTKGMNHQILELNSTAIEKRILQCKPMTSVLPYGVLWMVTCKEIWTEEYDKILETSVKFNPLCYKTRKGIKQ